MRRSRGLFFVMAMVMVAPAQAAPPPGSRSATPQPRFDIPAQSLADALDRFARQAGVQILYPYARAAALRSPLVKGRMPSRRALDRLLRGSGLAVARFGEGIVTLRAAQPAPPARARRSPQPAPIPSPAPPPVAVPAEIVVTGRALQTPVTATQLSYALTRIDPETLARAGPLSTADLFKQIPGFWVESTGGEASNNIRSRGIPTDGYSSVALLEDGLPVQYDGGLGYLNTDQIFRSDATIDHIEAVRGGPSAIFAGNAPGGSIDFLTRNPLQKPGVTLAATGGNFGYARIDGYAGMRLTPELGIAIGGFYRRDDGLRDPGYPADRGGQIRAGVQYDDGTTRLSFNVKHLDDRVILYLPVPLQVDGAGRVNAVPGFDPLYDTLAGPDNASVAFKTPSGSRLFDLSKGTRSRIDFYTLFGRRALGGGAALEVKVRLRTGDTSRDGLFPIGRPQSGDSYVSTIWPQLAAAFPMATKVEIRDAGTGRAFLPDSNGNGLVVGANLLSVALPMREFIGDARLTGQVSQWGQHDLALGLTYADSRLDYDRTMGTVLLDVRGQARRLDVGAVDADGRRVGSLTDNGFVRYGSLFDDVTLKTANLAVYAADEWKLGEHWRIDLGGRWERTRIGGRMELSSAVDLGDPTTLADDSVLAGTGLFQPIDRHFSGFSMTAGINFNPDPGTGLFLRATRISRLPSASEFYADPDRTDEAIVPIVMAEAGLIVQRRNWNFSAVLFRTHFKRLPFTDYRFDPATSIYVSQTSVADTTATGMEVSAHARLIGPLSIDMQATVQDLRYGDFRYSELSGGTVAVHDVTGNQLIRVPRIALRASPSVDLISGRLHLSADFTRYSARFADIANSQRLPPFSMINVEVSTQISDHATLTLNGTNLTNSLGLTEGNPRMGSFDAGGMNARYFLARPEFGRTVRATYRLSY